MHELHRLHKLYRLHKLHNSQCFGAYIMFRSDKCLSKYVFGPHIPWLNALFVKLPVQSDDECRCSFGKEKLGFLPVQLLLGYHKIVQFLVLPFPVLEENFANELFLLVPLIRPGILLPWLKGQPSVDF